VAHPPRQPDDSFKAYAYEQVARIGQAVSSPQRLVLLNILCQGPHGVEELAQQAGLSVANTSRHLQVLKGANLATNERQGTRVVYSVTGDEVRAFFRGLKDLAWLRLGDLRAALEVISASPSRAETLDRDALLERVRCGDAVVVDVRPEEEYARGHLPGAVSMPLEQVQQRLGELPQDRTIVAYCRGRFCVLADKAVEVLRAAGYDARRTDEDAVAWELDGLPVERDARAR